MPQQAWNAKRGAPVTNTSRKAELEGGQPSEEHGRGGSRPRTVQQGGARPRAGEAKQSKSPRRPTTIFVRTPWRTAGSTAAPGGRKRGDQLYNESPRRRTSRAARR